MGKRRKRQRLHCECCDTMQLLQDHLREVARDAQAGREVKATLWQLVQLARAAVLCCDTVHTDCRYGLLAGEVAGDVPGQLVFGETKSEVNG